MITFSEFLKNIGKITESKQVGTIYHFTKISNLMSLMDLDKQKEYGADEILTLFSMNGVISTSRNYNLSKELGGSLIHTRNGYVVRIALDGDKISEKYKIKPVLGLKDDSSDIFNLDKNNHRMSRHDGENEDIIVADKLPISAYIKRIDFLSQSPEMRGYYENIVKPRLDVLGIKSEIRKVWTPVKLEETFETDNSGFEILL